jgi:NAD(P)-dependent dehydrogenase (short-subunit alcohol dehydrogenase family)
VPDANASASKPRDIAGKTVLLTGASGGIGRCIVPALLAAGVSRVIAADRRPESWDAPEVEPAALDITDRSKVAELAARCADEVDLLINNAGHNHNTRLLEVDDPDNAAREMQVNYFGTLNMIRAFGAAMRRRGHGVIVNMLTVGSHVCFPNMGSYCASKAALHSLTQSVRAELGFYGVDVIGIYPPAVDTKMSSHVPAAQKIAPERVAAELVAALRHGPEDVYIGMAGDLYDRARREPKAVEDMLKARVAPAAAGMR